MNENCHKSRTSHDIDIKLRPVTKLSKKNAATSKIFEEDIMSINCDVIVIFLIYGQFGAIHKPDFRRVACKTYISININLLSHKNWQNNQKISNIAFIPLLWVKLLFSPIMRFFFQKKKNSHFSRIKRKGALVLKRIFSETTYLPNFKFLA